MKTQIKITFLPLVIQTFAAVNYAQQYQQALQEIYSVDVRFGRLYNTPNNQVVRWTSAKTVQVPSITTGGFVDVNRDVLGTFTRRVDNDYQTYTLEHDREFRTLVDPMDIEETNMAMTIANITRVFNRDHKVPELDKYMSSKLLAEYNTHGGTADTTVLTNANILDWFDKAMEEMDDAEVPMEGRILYLTPAMNTAIKQADQLQRTLDVRNISEERTNRKIRSLDEVEIITVPSSRMKSAYDFTDGAVAAPTAKQINAILIHDTSLYAPQRYEFVSLDAPSAATGGKYLYYERKYWDVFLIPVRVSGVKFNVQA